MYIANKPAKYGIQLVMVCDNKSKFMLKAIPYLGRNTQPPPNMSLGHYFTTQLVKDCKNSNRNVTSDNWFTSLPLVDDLSENYGMTLVGTLRANKPYIPPDMLKKKVNPDGCTAFLFDKNVFLQTSSEEKQVGVDAVFNAKSTNYGRQKQT